MKLTGEQLDEVVCLIAEMSREELLEQFRVYPAPFKIDFSDAFLQVQSTDKLRHVFAGLVLNCRIAPDLQAA